MASPGVTMRQPSADGDDHYKIPREEPFSTISEDNRQSVISCIALKDCPDLANKLGLTENERDEAVNRQDCKYPATAIFTKWTPKPGSTIWVLEDTFRQLNLGNALKCLKLAQYDKVTLYIFMYTSETDSELTTAKQKPLLAEGRKPLFEVVRAHAQKTFALDMTKRDAHLIFKLVRSGDEDQKLDWHTPAKLFKGQQVNIKVERRKIPSDRPHTDNNQGQQNRTRVERNVISWIEEDSLFFEYDDITTQGVQETGEGISSSVQPRPSREDDRKDKEDPAEQPDSSYA